MLFAHVVGTKCRGEVITDGDMDYPRDFRTDKKGRPGVGHQEDGRTVAIHSLAVHPKLQGCGLGKLILKAYMQQVNNSGTADRISLISQGVSTAIWSISTTVSNTCQVSRQLLHAIRLRA